MSDTKAITFNRLPILGKPKVEFEDWKFSYERWCKTNEIDDDEKVECLISITEGTERTIVINSLNKDNPDNYDTTINKLKAHFKSSLPKNSRLLELSTITIKKGETVGDFSTKFDTLLNHVNVQLTDEVIISYYINAFRSIPRTYEALLEEEPKNLEDAKKITTKKEKIYNLIGINKSNSKFSQDSPSRSYNDNYPQRNNHVKYYSNNYNNFNKNNNSNNNNVKNYSNNTNNTNKPHNHNNPNYQKFNNINQNIEYRRNTLKYPQPTNEELQEITKKLADSKINVCINCQRIGHVIDDCPELEETEHLN